MAWLKIIKQLNDLFAFRGNKDVKGVRSGNCFFDMVIGFIFLIFLYYFKQI